MEVAADREQGVRLCGVSRDSLTPPQPATAARWFVNICRCSVVGWQLAASL